MSFAHLYNYFRDGCRPFIEIYEGYNKVLTTEQEYERLPSYDITNGKVVYNILYIDLKLNVLKSFQVSITLKSLPVGIRNDITLIAYHSRQLLGRSVPIKIFQLQFHSDFLMFPDGDDIVIDFTKLVYFL